MLKMLERIREARRNDEDGFTLIELLIVIVILGVLAGIVVFSVQGIQDRGQEAACKADVATVQTAAEAYYASQTGPTATYATTITDLKATGFLKASPKETFSWHADTSTWSAACPNGEYFAGT